MLESALARAKRPFMFASEVMHARQTGLIPLTLSRAIQRGVQSFTYKGISMQKHPIDLAIYSELIWNLKPKTIIEIGSAEGGSALWFRDTTRNFMLNTQVISIDLDPPTLATENVRFIKGDANHLELDFSPYSHPWLVIEDSSHLAETTFNVLNCFSVLMAIGDYIVVEDGNVVDIGNAHRRGGGPLAAIHEFITENRHFEIVRHWCDRFGHNVTANPDGYLRRFR